MSWVWTSPMAGSPFHKIPPLRTKQTGQNPPYSIGGPDISKSCTRSGETWTVLQVFPSSSYLQEHFQIRPKWNMDSLDPAENHLINKVGSLLFKLITYQIWYTSMYTANHDNITIAPESCVSYFCVLWKSAVPFLWRCSIANLRAIVGPDGKRGHLSEL